MTELELHVLKFLWESSEGNGHDFGFTEDGIKGCKTNRQLSGVISSLSKKGILTVYDKELGCTQFTWAIPLDEIKQLLNLV